ncbi:MAG: hypothetical protein ACREEM_41345 [Blastocatellia bacterium]
MGAMTLLVARTELQRRVTQLSNTDANAAINRAVRWCNRQGSFTFQLSDPTTLTVAAATGLATIPVTMDTGKAHLFYNTNGVPVRRVGVQDVWQSFNFKLPTDAGWDIYIITQTTIVFFPAVAGQPTTVNAIFHRLTTDLVVDGDKNSLPRDFDDLVIDFAEAEERRLWDVGEDWPQILARVQDQIKVLLDGYRSVTIEPMPASEAEHAVTQKLQVGRA